MALVSRIQGSFSAGELSPKLDGRTDIEKYPAGLKTCLNFIPTSQGPIHNRSGSRFVGEVANSSNKSALYRYAETDQDAFILEFSGDGTFRIVREDANGSPALVEVQDQTVDLDAGVIDTTGRTIYFADGHGFTDGFGPVRLTTTGTLPSGFATGTDYFIRLFPTAPFAAADVTPATDTIDLSAASPPVRSTWGPYRFGLGSTAQLGDELPAGGEPLTPYFLEDTGGNVCKFYTSQDLSGAALDLASAVPTGDSGDLVLTPMPIALRQYAMLATTAGGAPIDPVDAGSGTMTLTQQSAAPIQTYAHPYSETEIFELRIRQSEDTLVITHRNHRPRIVRRLSVDSWVFDHMDFYDGPYADALTGPDSVGNLSSNTLSGLGAAKGRGVVNNLGVSEGPFRFRFEDFGRLFSFETEETATATITRRTWGVIIGNADDISAQVIHLGRFDNPGNVNTIRFGAFSDDPDRGWPRACAFFEQRLALAGTILEPQTVFLSVQGDFFTHSPTVIEFDGTNWSSDTGSVLDTNAIVFEVASEETSTIEWLRQFKGRLMLGTSSGVWAATGVVGEAMTPTNVRVFPVSTDGSGAADAIVVENLLVHISRSGRLVLGVGYAVSDDDLVARDLTLLADHIAGTGIAELAYAKEPDRIIWTRKLDGSLAALTIWDQQEQLGWSRHILAGTGPGGSGDAEVESIEVIHSANLDYDALYMVVRRRIDGSDVRYIERFEPRFEATDAAEDQWFLDSALETTAGLPSSAISGLDHLEGEEVYALRDGIVDGPHTVSSGAITLSADATSKVIVGLRYDCDAETLRALAPQPDGSGQSRAKAIRNLVVRVDRSFGGQIGPDSSNLRTFLRRKRGDDVNQAPALQTLDHEVDGYDGGVEGDPRIFLRQHLPLNMSVLAYMYDADVGSRPGGGG